MHLLKSSLMSGITMCGHIHIMVTRLRSKPGQESAIIKTQVLQKCLTTTSCSTGKGALCSFLDCNDIKYKIAQSNRRCG